jgi:ribose/xylose/arabinose/galactoside ABC-type transport system permease subunit
MTLSLISGGLDLSVGSLLVIGAVFSASLTSYNNLFLPIVVLIIITMFLGFLSGLIISKFRIQPFIVTMSMMLAARGIVLTFTNERPILVNSKLESFAFLGRGYVKGIPVLVIIVIICYLIIWYILNYTSFGRNIYAVGGNENAAKLMGIDIQKVKMLVYTIIGIFAGLAGILLSARLGAGNPTTGSGYEMDAIASAVIIGVISNVLNLIGISSWY